MVGNYEFIAISVSYVEKCSKLSYEYYIVLSMDYNGVVRFIVSSMDSMYSIITDNPNNTIRI